ncbi:MAG: PepSY domain-containing protein [Planctomycetaceae bacterium]|jgi:uncharacterized iron-regulated membrane protein|nr:PepSY domain-containing protein [Planctomycetaceae bacterium]
MNLSYIRRFFYEIHLWLGILSGIVVFIVCVSGGIYAFREEVTMLHEPQKYFVKVPASQSGVLPERISVDDLVKKLETENPGQRVSQITIPDKTNRTITVNLTQARNNFGDGSGLGRGGNQNQNVDEPRRRQNPAENVDNNKTTNINNDETKREQISTESNQDNPNNNDETKREQISTENNQDSPNNNDKTKREQNSAEGNQNNPNNNNEIRREQNRNENRNRPAGQESGRQRPNTPQGGGGMGGGMRGRVLFLNPYTGEVVDEGSNRKLDDFFMSMMQLHRNLLIDRLINGSNNRDGRSPMGNNSGGRNDIAGRPTNDSGNVENNTGATGDNRVLPDGNERRERRGRGEGFAGGERRERGEGFAGGERGERRGRGEGFVGGERRERGEGFAEGERRGRGEGVAGGERGERRERGEGFAEGERGERRGRGEGVAGGGEGAGRAGAGGARAGGGRRLSIGRLVVGVATLIFVVVLVSGFVLWLPRNLKGFKSWKIWRTGLRIRVTKGFWPFVYDLHNTVGFYTLIPILILALTGLCWSFDWYRNSVSWLLDDELFKQRRMRSAANTIEPVDEQMQPLSIEEIIKRTDAFIPGKGAVVVNIPANKNGVMVVQKGKTGFFALSHKDSVQWDRFRGKLVPFKMWVGYSGPRKETSSAPYAQGNPFENIPEGAKVVEFEVNRFADKKLGEKIAMSIRSLHFGDVTGLSSKLIFGISCILASSFPITGIMIWIKKLRTIRRKPPKNPET